MRTLGKEGYEIVNSGVWDLRYRVLGISSFCPLYPTPYPPLSQTPVETHPPPVLPAR
jgi:hypothetical protein